MKRKLNPKTTKTQNEKSQKQSDFTFETTKIAVSQICKSAGFKSTQLSVLETLTNISILYLKNLAKTSVSYTNGANRTQSNVFDIINALEDLSSSQGFVGASTLYKSNSCLLNSRVVKDLIGFVNSTNEIPFAKPIPRVISMKMDNLDLNFNGGGFEYVPKWLPAFPDKKTYEEKIIEKNSGLWENSCNGVGIGNVCNLGENVKKKMGSDNGELAMERRRVRFRIGEMKKERMDKEIIVYKRNWAGKEGKRVCFEMIEHGFF